MEGLFTGLLENSTWPLFSALLLGLMTAVSPCPLATNITAIGYIGKDIDNRNRVFISGLIYTLGRAFSYTLLAVIIFLGADLFSVSGIFQLYGKKLIGPVLIIIGVLMLDILNIRFPGLGNLTGRFEKAGIKSYRDVFILGILFALAFCPYSGVIYFGMLMPITVSSPSGLYLPVVFAIATGIPVLIFAWLIAYAVSGVGKLYNRIQTFEKWFRRIISVVFIGVGIYYIINVYF